MQIGDKEKQKSLDVAEESREAEWKYVSFIAEIFKGNFRWDLICPFPEQSPEDKKIGDDYIEQIKGVLDKYIDPDAVDKNEELPAEALQALAEAGAFGMKIPKKYGGLEFTQVNYARVMAYISSHCQSTGAWLSAHQSIGVPQPVKMYGTEEMKQKYLPLIAKGAVTAFCLTEPDVGSDPSRLKTTATPSEDGSHYIINGEKLWITNGPSADFLVVMAKTPPKIVDGKERTQISAFIVEKTMEGFEVPHKCSFMGIRGISNGLLRFNNVKVPKENLIGGLGAGLKVAFGTLNVGRLTIPATSMAACKYGLMVAQDWANRRVQWGAAVGKHQNVAVKLANMAATSFAIESITMLTCHAADRQNADIRLEAAMAKYYASEAGWKIADDLLQVRGGRGYETGPSLAARGEQGFAVERFMRDARIARIVEGTSEIMQLFIAREAMDLHVRQIMPMMEFAPDGNMLKLLPKLITSSKLRGLIGGMIKFYTPWLCQQYFGKPAKHEAKYLSAANQAHLDYIAKASKLLARSLFFAMGKYQAKLEREQIIMGAFVDIGTDLFTMSASLANAERILASNPDNRSLQDLVDLYCRNAKRRIAANFRLAKNPSSNIIRKVSNAFMEGEYEWMYTGVHNPFQPLRAEPSKSKKK